jgi:radical SAM protein with 4Fe4S-binding SPASM domain
MRPHKRPFKLRELKIEVTHRCPLACIHCSSNSSAACCREMSEDACLRILREAAQMGASDVAFSGGEPLLWPGIGKAVEAALSAGFRVSVYTSGCTDDARQRIRRLAQAGCVKWVFSLHGSRAQVHDRVTGRPGSFDSTLEAVSSAAEMGLQTEFHFVPLRDTYAELDPIARLAKGYGVSGISVLRLVPQGRAQAISGQLLSRDQNFELRSIIERVRREGTHIRTGSPLNFLMPDDQPSCSSAIDRLTIGPDLRIHPCDAFKQVKAEALVGTLEFSSLADASLADCWENSPYLEAIREYLTTPFGEPCACCPSLEGCLSGCLAQKVILHGDLAKRPDPMCLLG